VKHSAKAVARQARERSGQDRAGHDRAGHDRAGHDRAAGRDIARTRLLNQLPYLVVLAGIVLGLVLMRGGGQAVRGGTLVIAGALLAGSLIRMVLPERRAGLLGSRRRLADVAVLTALGVGLLIAGLIVQVPS
jgi:Protein of unknown function (DUF3017)